VVDYRERLRDAYVSTHFGNIRRPNLAAIERGFPYVEHHFLPHLPADRTITILDAGCGYGALLHSLRQHGYRNAVGVDSSPEQIELARRLGIEGIHQADAADHLRASRGRYDVVFALDLLEHLEKPQLVDLVDSVATALRPGGKFIAQTANAGSPFAGRIRYGDLTHELAFTDKSIAQVLRLGGFETVSVHGVEPVVHDVKSALRFATWRCIRSLLVFYLAAETGVAGGHIVSQNLIAVGVKS